MKYRRVGKSGLRISELSLGAWLTYGATVEDGRAQTIIRAAIDEGVNYIDIADIYSNGEAEKVVGQAIKNCTRSDLVISSKVFWPMSKNVNDRGLSRKHITESVEKSLRRIGTDYLDIYYCHRFDPECDMEETVRTMNDLVAQGKVLYWGTSVWDGEQIEQAIDIARDLRNYLPSVEQPCYNMLDRHIEEQIMPTCAKDGIGLTVWSPLAQGLLTGKYADGRPAGTRGAETKWLNGIMTEENIGKVKVLTKLASELEITVGQMALAWILRRPEISCAIIGATNLDQLKENLAASEVTLADDVFAKIEGILGGAVGS